MILVRSRKLCVTKASSAQREQFLCNEADFDAECPVAQSTRPGTLDSIGDSGRLYFSAAFFPATMLLKTPLWSKSSGSSTVVALPLAA